VWEYWPRSLVVQALADPPGEDPRGVGDLTRLVGSGKGGDVVARDSAPVTVTRRRFGPALDTRGQALDARAIELDLVAGPAHGAVAGLAATVGIEYGYQVVGAAELSPLATDIGTDRLAEPVACLTLSLSLVSPTASQAVGSEVKRGSSATDLPDGAANAREAAHDGTRPDGERLPALTCAGCASTRYRAGRSPTALAPHYVRSTQTHLSQSTQVRMCPYVSLGRKREE